MKVTKSQLKQIIKEEIESSEEVVELLRDISFKLDQGDMLEQILQAINKVDGSLDYVAAAITGESPYTIGTMQKSLGRLYTPRHGYKDSTDVNIKDNE
tara:strand:- start:411 stop:704 length:294 start_codon:yes stop_codon:yes gene_type:complete